MKVKFVKPSLTEFSAVSEHSLMRNLQDQKIPVASSCGGEGICGKCKVIVLSGSENISAKSNQEESLMKRLKIEENYRLSCQCYLLGDVKIDTLYW